MSQIIFETYYTIMDIIVIRLYLETVFSKAKPIHPCCYWMWLAVLDIFPLPVANHFFGVYSLEKGLVLSSLSFITFFLMTLLYEASLRHRIFASFAYLLFASLSEDIPGTILHLLSTNHLQLTNKQIEGMVQALYSFCFLFLISILRIFYRKKERSSLTYSITILVIPVLSLIILGDTSQVSVMGDGYRQSVIIKSICLFLINLINFELLDKNYTIQFLEEKNSALNRQITYQINKYTQISDAYRKTRSIIHDAEKHFLYLKHCIEHNDTEHSIPYMNHALHEMESAYNKINTGNLVVDSFLNYHMEVAKNKNISYTTDLNIQAEFVPVKDYDLSIILGNLLDNAFNECEKIDSTSERFIHVQIVTTEKALHIHVLNTCRRIDKKSIKKKSSYNLYHGYGLINVRNLVTKYYGSYDFMQNEKCFDAAIMIPIIKTGEFPKRN